MPLQKQNVNINFAQGLDTKSDPFQIPMGKFLILSNMTFSKNGLLQKRNGFQPLATPLAGSVSLATFQGNLISVSNQVNALLQGDAVWKQRGQIQPLSLDTIALASPTKAQTVVDAAIYQTNNLACVAWQDASNSWYQVQDLVTGQILVTATQLPSGAKNPRVFQVGIYFVITFTRTVTATPKLQYIAISTTSLTTTSATDLSTSVKADTSTYDGVVANNRLYLGWNGADGGGALRITYLSAILVQGGTTAIATYDCSFISLTADTSGNTPVIWFSFRAGTTLYGTAYNSSLINILTVTSLATSVNNVVAIVSSATASVMTLIQQYSNDYSYSAIRSDNLKKLTCTIAGVASANSVFARGVGLASKSFFIEDYGATPLLMVAYGSANSGLLQPTYFIVDATGSLLAKLAYSNGGGCSNQFVMPNVSIDGTTAHIAYLFKEILQAANPGSLTPPSSASNIYAQTGLKLAKWNFSPDYIPNVELGKNLNFGGGMVWAYDGASPAEQNFVLTPENVVVTTNGAGGNITAQDYYYVATYEWTDAQNNIHRSGTSVPSLITTVGATSTNTVNVPTLRLTHKSNVRIVIYRWSVAQPVFYQITSITSPTLNDTTTDSIAYSDTAADSSILGNNILYTTGGVLDNESPPAASGMTLFKQRVFLVDAEDKNLLWYSKQVIEAVPVEFSGYLTSFVAPTLGAQGQTGDMTALAPMDDKLIIFKDNAIYYIVGTGPDITGANNDFSDPIFVTATVGTSNPSSIVLTPQGLMFQSDKGIWLLGRDLSTQYIGADVEAYNDKVITSANTIPGTNQVRFTMNDKTILVYDYFYGQWATFTTNQNVLSATLFQDFHTYLTDDLVLQETTGVYKDNATPVLMGFTTGWLNFAGLQGFQRAYLFSLLGVYLSPHQLYVTVGFDFNPATQSTLITPNNFSLMFGNDENFGSTPYFGGQNSLEQWRILFNQQKCESIQIGVTEVFDSSFGTAPGAGFTLSGINVVVGAKKGYLPLPAAQTVG